MKEIKAKNWDVCWYFNDMPLPTMYYWCTEIIILYERKWFELDFIRHKTHQISIAWYYEITNGRSRSTPSPGQLCLIPLENQDLHNYTELDTSLKLICLFCFVFILDGLHMGKLHQKWHKSCIYRVIFLLQLANFSVTIGLKKIFSKKHRISLICVALTGLKGNSRL